MNRAWNCSHCNLQNNAARAACQACFHYKEIEEFKQTQVWESLSRSLFLEQHFTTFNNEIIGFVATNWVLSQSLGILYKYCANTDHWDLFVGIEHIGNSRIRSIAVDHQTQEIYVQNNEYLIIIDTKTKQQQIYQTNIWRRAVHSIIIDSKYHVIDIANKHFIWNKADTAFIPLTQYSISLLYVVRHQLVYDADGGKLLLMGGMMISECSDSICVCSVNDVDMKWNRLNCKLPRKMSDFGCVMHQNDVIFIGGFVEYKVDTYEVNGRFGYVNDIFIWNVVTNQMKIRNVKCPYSAQDWGRISYRDCGLISALIINDIKEYNALKERALLMIGGFVRTHNSINRMLSDDVIGVMLEMYGVAAATYIHLFFDKKHWRINLNVILDPNNMKVF